MEFMTFIPTTMKDLMRNKNLLTFLRILLMNATCDLQHLFKLSQLRFEEEEMSTTPLKTLHTVKYVYIFFLTTRLF